jgi:hypothetical protein
MAHVAQGKEKGECPTPLFFYRVSIFFRENRSKVMCRSSQPHLLCPHSAWIGAIAELMTARHMLGAVAVLDDAGCYCWRLPPGRQ